MGRVRRNHPIRTTEDRGSKEGKLKQKETNILLQFVHYRLRSL